MKTKTLVAQKRTLVIFANRNALTPKLTADNDVSVPPISRGPIPNVPDAYTGKNESNDDCPALYMNDVRHIVLTAATSPRPSGHSGAAAASRFPCVAAAARARMLRQPYTPISSPPLLSSSAVYITSSHCTLSSSHSSNGRTGTVSVSSSAAVLFHDDPPPPSSVADLGASRMTTATNAAAAMDAHPVTAMHAWRENYRAQ